MNHDPFGQIGCDRYLEPLYGNEDRYDIKGEIIHSDCLQDWAEQYKINQLAAVRIEIERAIGTVQDDTQRRLLRRKYINGLTLEQIAVEMHYSYVHTCRIHGYALSNIML